MDSLKQSGSSKRIRVEGPERLVLRWVLKVRTELFYKNKPK